LKLVDLEELLPRLEKLGPHKVREMLAAYQFKGYEEKDVKEWLARQDALQKSRARQNAKQESLARQVAVDALQATNEIKDIKTERGCRLLIRKYWHEIKIIHGKDAKAHQVRSVLRLKKEEDEKLPSLKTVRNRLIDLRKEKLIP
jgi:hypothetical protein